MIAYFQQELRDAAILKIKGKYDDGAKAQVAIALALIVPGVLDMGIYEK